MQRSHFHIILTLILCFATNTLFGQMDYNKEAKRCFLGFTKIEYTDLKKAKMYADSAMIYAVKSGDHVTIARAHQYLGWHYEDVSSFKRARKEYYKSLASYKRAKNEQGIADAYGNLGNSYLAMDLFKKSLEYQLKSLTANKVILFKILTEDEYLRAQEGKTYALHNIAAIYTDIGLYESALEYDLQSLKDEVIAGNIKGEVISCSAVAIGYKYMNNVDSATFYFERAIAIYDTLDNVAGLASTYFAYATMEGSKLSEQEKKRMITLSLKMHLKNGDMDSHIHQLLTIGSRKFDILSNDSIGIILASVDNGIRSHDLVHHRMFYFELQSKYFARIGKHKLAYDAMQKYLDLKVLDDEEKRGRKIIIGNLKHDLEVKSYNDSIVLNEHFKVLSAVDQKKIAEQRSWIVVGVLGGLILIASLFFAVYSNRRKRRLNEVLSGKNAAIHEKNKIVEDHNRSVAASIQYAKRLQTAILPTRENVNEFLPDSFLLFRPKDVVSGDFYWFETVNDVIYFAVADCTGHGVPGAMVSVVCSNALHRVLKEFKIVSPGDILTKTRELVIETFGRSDDKVEDGMDIALCVIHTKEQYVQYAGANNPLWIVRKNSELDEHNADRILENENLTLLEYKANNQPVGLYPNMKNFSDIRIELKGGDQLYMLSDGFADQFGGELGKKFKSALLKKEILNNAHQPMAEQGIYLAEMFSEWQGDLDQVDDVCIIGFKL